MKAAPLLVAWHNDNTPIYSADFETHGKGRLATAGGDNNVRLWKIEGSGEDRTVSYLSTLVRHTQAVNVVRWCPRGEMLASAGDDGTIILWVPSDNASARANFGEDGLEDKETWREKTMCRSSGSEIYDLAWSPDGMFFITGSMDNITRIYNAHTGALARQVADHNHYVQGVAWDPLNEYIATQSSDRSVHVYTLKTKDGTPLLTKHNHVSKMEMPARRVSHNSPAPTEFRGRAAFVGDIPAHAHALGSPAPSAPGTPQSLALPMNPPMTTHSRRSSFGSVSAQSMRRSVSPSPSMPLPAVMPAASPSISGGLYPSTKATALYANETFTSFFRRLTFSPDGSLLFTPAGQHKEQHHPTTEPSRASDDMANMTYIYTRAGLNKPPVAKLPGHKKPSLAVKCSPVYYTLRTNPVPTKEITIDTRTEDDIPALPEPILPAKPPSSYSAMDPPPIAPSPAPSGAAAPSPRSAEAEGSETPGPSSLPPPVFDLPYRLVYAVATQDAVHVYDTQQAKPLCVVSNLHYATFTDLSWAHDGQTLLITSSDGFCSCLTFASGELGAIYHHPPPQVKQSPMAFSAASPAGSTPAQTPLHNPVPPPMGRQLSSQGPNPSPSPFTVAQPASPARSVSNASIFTQASAAPMPGQDLDPSQADTPQVSAMPGLTATNSGPPTVGGVPLYTPPQTPGYTAAVPAMSSFNTIPASNTTVEKREGDAAEERGRDKRRRIAPTPVTELNSAIPPGTIAPPPVPTSQASEAAKSDQTTKQDTAIKTTEL